MRWLLLAFIVPLAAQNRATITGTLRDASGAVIKEASVVVVNHENGIRRATESNASGEFTISTLAAGTYKITVRKDGFRTVARMGLSLAATEIARVDFTLEIGSMSETITVEGEPALTNTEDAASRVVFPRTPFEKLPLDARGIPGLLALVPGVLTTPATAGEAGQFTANGQRPNTNYFLVDGVSANSAVTGTGLIGEFPGGALPSMTAIGSLHSLAATRELQDIRVQTSSFAPEFGKLPGAQVAVTTRSGSNEYHGDAFFQFGDEKLNANNWFANRSGLRRADASLRNFGASIGGPVRSNQTFFFANVERVRLKQPFTAQTVTPTLRARAGADPVAAAVLKAFPIPDRDAAGERLGVHTANFSRPASITTGSLRIDQAIGTRGTAFLRYKDTPSTSANGYLQVNEADFQSRGVTLGIITALSPRVTNDTRVSVSRSSVSTKWIPAVSLGPVFPSSPASLRAVWIEGVGQVIEGTGDRSKQAQWNIASTIAWSAAKHQVRAGIDYQRLTPTRDRAFNAVTGHWTGLTQLLAGEPPVINDVSAGAGSSVIEVFSLFAQDTWSVTPRLNITYGARWEFTPAPSFRTPTGQPPTALPTTPIGSVGFPEPIPSVGFPEAGGRIPFWGASYKQFAPRVGLAYRLNESTIVRAGAGIFYDTGFVSATALLNGAPFNRWRTFLSPNAGIATAASSIDYGYAPNLRLPYATQWNVTLERVLWDGSVVSAGYVGSNGSRLLRRESYAQPGTDVPRIVLATNTGESSFHSLQLNYRRRFANGVGGSASYTWGHTIDNGSWDSAIYLVDATRGFTSDRGPAAFDARHSLETALSYDFKGWTVSGMMRTRTGFPIDVVSSENAFGLVFDNLTRPDLLPGVPVWLNDAAAPTGRRLNPAAFRIPGDGKQGALGRNGLRGFGHTQLDAALQRDFKLDFATLRLRAEMLNVTNSAQFGDPVRFLSNPLFGQSVSMLNQMLGRGRPNAGLTPAMQTGGPRTLQVGVQFRF